MFYWEVSICLGKKERIRKISYKWIEKIFLHASSPIRKKEIFCIFKINLFKLRFE